jgi:nucleoside-diphosphate-sugar epimerase
MRWVADSADRSLLMLRPVVVFGEGHHGNVYNLIEQLRRHHLPMIGSGRNRKSIAYVGNIVEFVCCRLRAAPGCELFNYSDVPDKTMRELVASICALLNRPAPEWSLPYWMGLSAGYIGDALALLSGRTLPISSIRMRKFCANTEVSVRRLDATGFERPFSLDEGLARTIADVRARA